MQEEILIALPVCTCIEHDRATKKCQQTGYVPSRWSSMHILNACCAGIPSGLVRMSVGITGTLEQRWLQLRESFLAATSGHSMASVPVVHSIDAMAHVQAQKMANIITSGSLLDEPPSQAGSHRGHSQSMRRM